MKCPVEKQPVYSMSVAVLAWGTAVTDEAQSVGILLHSPAEDGKELVKDGVQQWRAEQELGKAS